MSELAVTLVLAFFVIVYWIKVRENYNFVRSKENQVRRRR